MGVNLVISLRAIDDAVYHGVRMVSDISTDLGECPSDLEFAMLLCALVVEFARAESTMGDLDLDKGLFAHLVAQSYDQSLKLMRDYTKTSKPRAWRRQIEKMRAEFKDMLGAVSYAEALGSIVQFLEMAHPHLIIYAKDVVREPEYSALLTLFGAEAGSEPEVVTARDSRILIDTNESIVA